MEPIEEQRLLDSCRDRFRRVNVSNAQAGIAVVEIVMLLTAFAAMTYTYLTVDTNNASKYDDYRVMPKVLDLVMCDPDKAANRPTGDAFELRFDVRPSRMCCAWTVQNAPLQFPCID
jgi:hypothetical protein